MKKCPKCSLNLDDSVMRCSYCGYDFAEEAVEAPAEVINEEVSETPPEAPAQPVYNQEQGGEYQASPPPNYNQQGYNPYSAPQGKYCPRCGNLCDPNAVICVKCRMSFGSIPQQNVDDKPSTGLKVVCFFFPIVALVLYLVEKDKKPISAKEYGKWGIIGVAVNIGLSVLSSILTAILGVANMGNAYYAYEEFDDFYYQILPNIISMLK